MWYKFRVKSSTDTLMEQPIQEGLQPRPMSNVNGILPVKNNAMMAAEEEAREALEEDTQQRPVVTGLAGHVKQLWHLAEAAKRDVEQRMLQSLRQRRGEYDPDVKQEIAKMQGSDVYMMLTSNKCRTATAWLKDTLLGTTDDKPWTIRPTSEPSLTPLDEQAIITRTIQEAIEIEQQMGLKVDREMMSKLMEKVKGVETQKLFEAAKRKLNKMETKMEDQLQEGGFMSALEDCIDDITTFPTAIMKGPVIRKRKRLKWVEQNGDYTAEVTEELVEEWERIDPFMIYPSAQSSGIGDGYLFERHRLQRSELEALRGVEGYNESAIVEVLDQYGVNGLHNWLSIDSQKTEAEGKHTSANTDNSDGLIDALQFWGSVQGKRLVEWGMPEKEVPDQQKEYNCELWLIGSTVIKAVLNANPLGEIPYYTASYEEVPGSFWGNGVTDLIRDCQKVCNAAARAIVNNMAIASGPQVNLNVDRLPAGEDITEMYPWKIWQTKSDPFATTAPAVDFFQPNIMVNELMSIYERFSIMADEYSSIPRYMTGDASTGGAGRTASGMSMLMSNAGKGIKNVIANVDSGILAPAIKNLYTHNMQFKDDPDIKGDVQIIAKGANSLVVKEQAQLRRNEFLQIALNSPVATEVVGQNGVAALLREGAKALDMEIDEIVPSREMLESRQVQEAMAVRQQQVAGPQGQNLQDGSPVTNNFPAMKS